MQKFRKKVVCRLELLPGMVHISIGLENSIDIVSDIEQALELLVNSVRKIIEATDNYYLFFKNGE